ncbi:GTPase-associated system all-helical protein GASH [Burkholderia ambifaria]|uniref:GTPase-associated system all-helical protein GASH n=1 Tax=Burkholderia ambifaria TaxID=152480 RepID=UPI001589CB9B|nr:GTPase-associated system all-helical protein GASH [Burkholderia ambifaria]
MGKKEFKFLEEYRSAAPSETREVVEARRSAHESLFALVKQMDKVYDLCRIAFALPFDKETVSEWFEKTVKAADIHFSLAIDKAEGARIATLVLRDLAWRAGVPCSLASLVASYCGKREPAGGGDLLSEARDAISASASERRIVLADKKIAMPAAKDLKAELDAAQTNFQGSTVRAALDAVSADLRDGTTKVANAANDAAIALRSDVTRLTEEVDMLWWYIGDWSELIDRPRTALVGPSIALVSAAELGDLVRSMPGPYGAYGLLRRALGKLASKKTSLKSAIEGIEVEVLSRLRKPLPEGARTLFPVHAAINLAVERGTAHWSEALEGLLGTIPAGEVTLYELAVHTFRERLLIGYGGLGK